MYKTITTLLALILGFTVSAAVSAESDNWDQIFPLVFKQLPKAIKTKDCDKVIDIHEQLQALQHDMEKYNDGRLFQVGACYFQQQKFDQAYVVLDKVIGTLSREDKDYPQAEAMYAQLVEKRKQIAEVVKDESGSNPIEKISEDSGLEKEQQGNQVAFEKTGIEMVRIPEGCFQMGSNEGKKDEQPVHEVCISKPFYLGKYEITQAQWVAQMGSNPTTRKMGGKYPVHKVDLHDIKQFIKKLNEQTGLNYRLPTEAEWEYACRSGGKQQKYCGSDKPEEVAHYKARGKQFEVGSKAPNDFGLYDMSGNVAERVGDFYVKNFYEVSGKFDPKGGDSSFNVMRGGNVYSREKDIRSTARARIRTRDGDSMVGFRLARDI